MQRLYLPIELTEDLCISDPKIHHQLTRVLRSRIDDQLILFSGDGKESRYTITLIDARSLTLRRLDQSTPCRETKYPITFYQALPNKYEKIEYILEKGVEIGVTRFIFFRSRYSQGLPITEKKKERFTSIALEALEQCGGLIPPEIIWIDGWDPQYIRGDLYLLDVGATTPLIADDISRGVTIMVGPEGGWSPEEIYKTNTYNTISVRISDRVLRTETAGVVASAIFVQKMFS